MYRCWVNADLEGAERECSKKLRISFETDSLSSKDVKKFFRSRSIYFVTIAVNNESRARIIKMSRETKLVKNTAIYFVGNFASKCLSFVLVPIYTAYLSAVDFGNINLLLLLSPILAQLFSCEILDGVYRFLMDAVSDERRTVIISNSIFIYGIGMALFLVIYLPFVLVIGFDNAIVFAFHIILVNYASLLLYICRGIKNNKVYAAGGVIQTLVQGVTNIVFIIGFKMGAVSILWAPICASVVVIIFLSYKIKLWHRIKFRTINCRLCKELVKYSFPLFVQVLFVWVLQNAGNYQLLAITGNSYLSGIYSMVNKFPQMIYAFTSIFVLAWQETAVEERKSKDKNEYYLSTYNKYVQIQLVILLLFIPLMYLYFTYYNQGDYENIKVYLPIAFFSSVLISMVNFITTNYIVNKKTKAVIVTSVIPAIVSFVLGQITIPFLGIYGIYLGSCVGYSIMYFMRKCNMKQEMNFKLNIRELIHLLFPLLFICFIYYLLPIKSFLVCTAIVYFYMIIIYRKEICAFLTKAKRCLKIKG